MRSPFGIFRKHGTILTAGLVVLCMFAFTLADFLKPQHLPALLAMLAFGVIFYLFGQPSGKGGWYAVIGALVGLVVISFIPNAFGPAPAVTTSIGNLSEDELQDLVAERRSANEFIAKVYRLGFGERPQMPNLPPSLMNDPQFQPFLMQSFRRQQDWDAGFRRFSFAMEGETIDFARQYSARNWVMAQQADEIGIEVSDAAVTEYLAKASNGNLTQEKFIEYRQDLGVSESQLYNMLREQIKAKEYQQLVYPRAFVIPPEESWDYYKRGTITEDLEFAAVPVEPFTEGLFPFTASAKLDYYQGSQDAGYEKKGEIDSGAGVDLVRDEEGALSQIDVSGTEYTQVRTSQLKAADKAYLKSASLDSLKLKSEVLEFFDQHKGRYPQGLIDRQDGWTTPVEAMTPEPAFGVLRRIKLAYVKLTLPAFDPTEEELKSYYESHLVNFPDPSFSRPLDEPEFPDPNKPAVAQRLDRGGAKAAVAEKPKIFEGPAWAEKREFLDFHHAREQARNGWVFEQEEKAREKNDERVSKLLTRMTELSVRYQSEADDHMKATEVSEALAKFASELGSSDEIEYVVTDLMTPQAMTLTKIGQAVEVDVQRNPLPGRPKVSVRTGGANVVFQMFRGTGPEDIYQPLQVISPTESDTRYVFWKIEDKEPMVPSRDSLSFEQKAEIAAEWKISEGRGPAKKRAEAIEKSLVEYFSKEENKAADLSKALADLKIENITGDTKLVVKFAPGFSWMEWDQLEGTARLDNVPGVEKAGEKFMETAFRKLGEGQLGVLGNADESAFYVGKVLNRSYGEAKTEQELLKDYLKDSSSNAIQIAGALEGRQFQEVQQRWLEDFEAKFQIQFKTPDGEE